jgi:Flp pilus assembly protein TadD
MRFCSRIFLLMAVVWAAHLNAQQAAPSNTPPAMEAGASPTPTATVTGTSGQPGALIGAGVLAIRDGKFPEAEDAFRKLMALEPGSLRAIIGLSQVYMASRRPAEAVKLVESEYAKYPLRMDLAVSAGDVEVRAGEIDKGLQHFRDALAGLSGAQLTTFYVPRGAPTGTLAGFRFSGNPQTDALAYLAARDATPKGAAGLHVRIAEAVGQKGDLAEALAEWHKAADLLPNVAFPRLNVGIVNEMLGKPADAIEAYKSTLAITPDDPIALNNLAFQMAATKTGDLYDAVRYARRAHELIPASTDVSDTLAYVSIKLGWFDDALDTLLGIVATAPENKNYRDHLVLALQIKPNRTAAHNELLKVLQDPMNSQNATLVQDLVRKVRGK